MDNSDSGMAKSKLDKSQVLVAVQLRVIYTIELLMSSIKLGLYRLYKKCSIILYNIYLDSFLYSFVFKLQAYFLNNKVRRKRLLAWLDTKLKPPYTPTNFDTDWRDGIRLCALCEAIIPGSCPRFDVLNPLFPRNNIRLALNMIKIYMQIKCNITEKEIYECLSESKLVHLLSQIRIFHTKRVIKNTGTSLLKMSKQRFSAKTKAIVQYFSNADDFFKKCHIMGMGVVTGVRCRRARFSIYFPTPPTHSSLVIEIVGPNESFSSEKVVIQSNTNSNEDQKNQLKSFDQIAQNLLMRAAMKTKNYDKNLKIPFFHECLEDHLMVTYVPLFSGEHQISIIWQGRHVLNSPHTVSIEETEYLEHEVNDIGPKFIPGLQYPLCLLNSDKEYKIDDMGTVIRRKIVKETIVSNSKEYDYKTYFKTKFSQHFLKQSENIGSIDKSPSPTLSIPSPDSPIEKNLVRNVDSQLESVPSNTNINNIIKAPVETISFKTKTKMKRNISLDHAKLMEDENSETKKLSSYSASETTLPWKVIFDHNNENFNEDIEKMKIDLEQKIEKFKRKKAVV